MILKCILGTGKPTNPINFQSMVITSGAEADRQNKYFLPISFFGLLALSPGYWLCHLRCLFHDDGDEDADGDKVDNGDDNDSYDNDDIGHC